MKTIGLLGGTGWVSTQEYYRIINQQTNKRLGGLSFPTIILYSVNYEEINEMNKRNDMEGVFSLVFDVTKKLINAGADGIVLGANTLHFFANALEKKIDKPIIHIASATAKKIKQSKLSKVALLGTKTTMEENFYSDKLRNEQIDVLIPDEKERNFIHYVIMNELLKSKFESKTKLRFLEIIEKLHTKGAEGIALACTEIPFLIHQEDIDIQLFNTLHIHATAAVDFAIGGQQSSDGNSQ
jgi:aspartate racemase